MREKPAIYLVAGCAVRLDQVVFVAPVLNVTTNVWGFTIHFLSGSSSMGWLGDSAEFDAREAQKRLGEALMAWGGKDDERSE